MNDDELLRHLLNGQRPRYRRERRASERELTVVTDPDLLDPYERLLYDEDPTRTKEQLALYTFEWGEHFTLEEATAWFAAGAGYRDLRTCVDLTKNGVSPEIARCPLTRRGADMGLTVFQAVVTHVVTAERVRQMIDARNERPA